jgi:hypothetical protein
MEFESVSSRKSAWVGRSLLVLSIMVTIIVMVSFAPASTWARSTSSESDAALETMQPWLAESGELVVNNCRYGASPLGAGHVDWLPTLGVGWYLNFAVSPSSANVNVQNIEFVPVITLKQAKDQAGNYLQDYIATPPLTSSGLGPHVTNNPGRLWLVGNEVERGPDPGQTHGGQGDMFAPMYARAYHEVYHFIKSRDPTAQVAISGLVQVTPGRLQYLDQVWDSYLQQFGTTIPVDVWNMHIYVLPEAQPNGQPNGIASIALGTNPALAKRESANNAANCSFDDVYCYAHHDSMSHFIDQVVAMRTWMKQKGQQNKPLILSEYSQLYPFVDYDDPTNPTMCFLMDEFGQCWTSQRVTNFVTASFNYLDTAQDPNIGYPKDNNRLVQQWMWYSVFTNKVGHTSNLVNSQLTQLTQVGQRFRDEVQARSLNQKANLLPDHLSFPVAFTDTPGGSVNVPISASVRNNGDVNVLTPFKVTFYRDAALQLPIGEVTVNNVLGCARRPEQVTITWNGLTTGVHRYWVKVDSSNIIPEGNEADNVAMGRVFVNPQHQVFMPAIRR